MNIHNVRRCVLYARLSVTKEESVSIARQLESGRKYADARGWQVVGEYIDDGVSATVSRPEDRKGWAALLAGGGFDAVVIWKVDRLARRVLDFLHADEALQARGAGLVAVEDPIDMTSPQGRAFAVMLAVFGEMEAEGIRARVRAARAHLIKDGRFVGGGIPYGYRSAANPDGPGRVLVKDPERSRWLADAVGLAQRGFTVNAIATWLTAQGAPIPARRKPRLDPDSVSWNRQTVEQLLRNPILAGMTPYNPGRAKSDKRADPFAVVRAPDGAPVIDESLAIVTYDEFAELQRGLDARDSPQSRKKDERERTSAFMSRIAVCDGCDVFMYRGTNQKKPVLYCPRCRQTLGRGGLDLYIVTRLLAERGAEPSLGSTVQNLWDAAGDDELARRAVLRSQLESMRIRRGVVGRRFDADRVLVRWLPATMRSASPGPTDTPEPIAGT